MSGFIRGIKRIPKKHKHLKAFVSLPISGNTREVTEETIESFKRLGVDVVIFDIEDKFNQYIKVVDPALYEDKEQFSSFVESFIEKDFLYDIVTEKPDFIFSFTNGFLEAKALKVARLMGTKVALYHAKEYSKDDGVDELFKECDALFTSPGFIGDMIDFEVDYLHKELAPGCDIHKHFPRELKKEYFVTIFGDVSLYKVNIANELIKKGVDVSIFGSGWREFESIPESVLCRVKEDTDNMTAEKWNDIFRKSYLVLTLPYEINRDGSVMSRINYMAYAAAGCGATLIGYSKDNSLSAFTHSEDIMLFENESELCNIIEQLKVNYDLTKFLGLSAVENTRLHNTTTKKSEEILRIIESLEKEEV